MSILLQGRELPPNTTQQRERLYRHLFERYKEEKEQNPDSSVAYLMFEIVNSPAPESFISPASIPKYIIEYREKRKQTRLTAKTNKNEKDIQRKDDVTTDLHSADNIVHSNTTSRSIEVRAEQYIDAFSQTDIYADAFQYDAPADKPVLSAEPCVPCKRKVPSTRRSRTDFSNPSKRFNRCHTNHRYIRSQLRIMWDADN